ncbi:MAG: hypothetical protein WA647_08740, partial [Candidatus Acidiferrum sp.]
MEKRTAARPPPLNPYDSRIGGCPTKACRALDISPTQGPRVPKMASKSCANIAFIELDLRGVKMGGAGRAV